MDVAVGIYRHGYAVALDDDIGRFVFSQVSDNDAFVGLHADEANAVLFAHGVQFRTNPDVERAAVNVLNDWEVLLAFAFHKVGVKQCHLLSAAVGGDAAGDGGKKEVATRFAKIESFFHNSLIF